MGDETFADLGAEPSVETSDVEVPESTRVYPLIEDRGNRRILIEWLADHDSYEAVEDEATTPGSGVGFDVCIVDETALREHTDELDRFKTAASPVLLPVLLLLPETRADVIETDEGNIADNVFPARVDEIVSLPIRQAELEWRLQALLRLRSQSIASQRQNENLRLFHKALESSGHAVYITDADKTIRYVNPEFEAITGYSEDEAVGSKPELLRSGEMPDEFYDRLWDTVLSGEVWKGDIIDRRANGELYAAEQTIAPVLQDGEIQAFVAVQIDITERKERKEALRRRTRAIDEAPIGISISDPDREDNPLIYVNDAFEDMTGYPREEVLGCNCRFLQGERTDPDQVARMREALEAEEPFSVDIRNYRKDGTEFWNHLEVAPVRDDSGDVVNYVGFQQDVTGRKERQRQLGVLDRVLRHNLRNRLNVIRGQAESIQSGTSEDVADSAQKIIETSDRLVGMAEKEREITKLLGQEPIREEIRIPDVLRNVTGGLESAYPEATITVDCPSGITVEATNQFNEAIGELVTNAIVHNDARPPEVTLSVTRSGRTTRIEVADNGPRIPETERVLLVDEEDPTPLGHGSGLGLWLVKLVVSRSNGSITLAENDPVGNVVRIEFNG